MSKKLSKKQRYIIVGVTAAWGLIFIGSGISMSFMNTPITKTTKELKITQKRVANMKSNEILLKPMEQEINQPISMNVISTVSLRLNPWLINVAMALTLVDIS